MDNANEAASIGMRNNYETISGRHAKRDVARLPMRMIGISASQRQSVPQCSCGLLERNPMLPEVGGGLPRVPFKAHRGIIGVRSGKRAG